MRGDSDKGYRLAVALLALVLAVPILIWQAYVFTILWAWFMVPTFGLPKLTIAAAIGLSLVATGIRSRRIRKDDSPEALMMDAARAALLPAFLLLAGWIVQHWMPT